MKPYITAEEVIEKQGENQRTYRFLTTENGCVNGCASGTTVYANTEFSDHPGAHDDQEGFYVLEGEGFAGVKHTLRTKEGCTPVKVFWFHSGI